jgi:hypothetical protein
MPLRRRDKPAATRPLKWRKALADAVGELRPGQVGESESREDAQSPKERSFLLQCEGHDDVPPSRVPCVFLFCP